MLRGDGQTRLLHASRVQGGIENGTVPGLAVGYDGYGGHKFQVDMRWWCLCLCWRWGGNLLGGDWDHLSEHFSQRQRHLINMTWAWVLTGKQEIKIINNVEQGPLS